MKYIAALSLILFLQSFGNQLTAQKIALNDKGEKIIVFDDGTWRPYTAADSILLKNENPEEFLIQDDSNISVFELPPDADIDSKELAKKRKSPEYKKLEEELKVLENKLYKFSRDPSIPESDLTVIRNNINEIKQRMKDVDSKMNAPTEIVEKSIIPSITNNNQEKTTATPFVPAKDMITNPPTPPCQYNQAKIDQFSSRKRIDMTQELFFTYTDPAMRPLLKTNEFLTCYLSLNEVSPIKFINLKFSFSTTTAIREYGELKEQATIVFLLVNGQTITLKNNISDPGTIDPKDGRTEYQALLPLSKAAEKAFMKSPIDKVRVVWSTGFEDYEVFNVDIIMNQLKCLNAYH